MSQPVVSVIIPAYNGADTIGEAIRSVLNQTFTNFEIIVVSDASPDNTGEVVQSFDDPRINYIVHEKNRGLPATRNTAVRASSGRYIALLDQDDIFHPEKLQRHVELLEGNSRIGVTYNSRFEIVDSVKSIRGLWRAPHKVDLSDLVQGYPFSPSDIILRREWLFEINLFDESNPFHGEDLNTNCRLALAGCQFGLVNRALNYRRNEQGRVRRNLSHSLENVFRNLEAILTDPRCPEDVRQLRDLAYANNYLVWAYWALAQEETHFGQQCLREAVRLKPSIPQGELSELIHFIITYAIDDERGELAAAMKCIFDQLPAELAQPAERRNWAVARAYLIKGTRDIMWGRPEEGQLNFAEAAKLGAEIDEPFLQLLTHQLMGYENEFGSDVTLAVIHRLAPHFKQIGGQRSASMLQGSFLINQAFQNYRVG